jgi:hypothetical protein
MNTITSYPSSIKNGYPSTKETMIEFGTRICKELSQIWDKTSEVAK